MDSLVVALGPAFAAGFAVQQLLEILDPVAEATIPKKRKKLVLGLIALAIGLMLAFGANLRVLKPFEVDSPEWIDGLATGLIVSAGTQGFNSIMKFLGYAKENKKAAAEKQRMDANLSSTGAAPEVAPIEGV